MREMYYQCNSLNNVYISNFKANNGTQLDYLFRYSGNVKYLNISNYRVKNSTSF